MPCSSILVDMLVAMLAGLALACSDAAGGSATAQPNTGEIPPATVASLSASLPLSSLAPGATTQATTTLRDAGNGRSWRSPQPVFMPNAGAGYKADWHEVEVYFQLNSIVDGKGQPDGIAQYWFDGRLVIDRHDIYLRTGAHPNMKFNQFIMAPYIGDGSPINQTIWYDDLIVQTARPTS